MNTIKWYDCSLLDIIENNIIFANRNDIYNSFFTKIIKANSEFVSKGSENYRPPYQIIDKEI